jgi:hypothetical protein
MTKLKTKPGLTSTYQMLPYYKQIIIPCPNTIKCKEDVSKLVKDLKQIGYFSTLLVESYLQNVGPSLHVS